MVLTATLSGRLFILFGQVQAKRFLSAACKGDGNFA